MSCKNNRALKLENFSRETKISSEKKTQQEIEKKEQQEIEKYMTERTIRLAQEDFEKRRKKQSTKQLMDILDIEDKLEDMSTSNTKRYAYIGNAKLMITYEGKIDHIKYETWIRSLSSKKRLNVDEILFSYTGECAHVLVIWDNRFQSQNKTIMDYDELHPLLRYIASPDQLRRAKAYMKRVDINNTPETDLNL